MFDFVSFIPRAVVQGVPLLFGCTGETLTEKSGNLNLGIPGICTWAVFPVLSELSSTSRVFL
ncbi:hypothetical protein EVA_08664, partial [gut metagenome]